METKLRIIPLSPLLRYVNFSKRRHFNSQKGPRHLVEALFHHFLDVLAVSINVACNSENQCLLMQSYC